MRSAGSSAVSSVRRNRPKTSRLPRSCWSIRITHGPRSSRVTRFRTCCSPAITPRSSAGAARRPPSGRAVAGPICSITSPPLSWVLSLYAVSNVIDLLDAEAERKNLPTLIPGDTVKVHAKVVEGTRERVQIFEGIVIGCRGSGTKEAFTVRRIAHGIGVERSFLLHSPRIDKIDVVRHGKVRRAKLYYLRGKVGKSARIREKRQAVASTTVPADPQAVAEETPENAES